MYALTAYLYQFANRSRQCPVQKIPVQMQLLEPNQLSQAVWQLTHQVVRGQLERYNVLVLTPDSMPVAAIAMACARVVE